MQAPSAHMHTSSPKQPMYCVWKVSKGIEMSFWICLECVFVCVHMYVCGGVGGCCICMVQGPEMLWNYTWESVCNSEKELYRSIWPLGHCDCTYQRMSGILTNKVQTAMLYCYPPVTLRHPWRVAHAIRGHCRMNFTYLHSGSEVPMQFCSDLKLNNLCFHSSNHQVVFDSEKIRCKQKWRIT